jgi:PAS domain S-box-containing protein
MASSERELIEAIGLSPLPMVVSNPRRADNPLEAVNDAFCALTGYGEPEIVGRNCRFLAGPQSDPVATEQIRAAIRGARPVLVEIVNYRADGAAFRNGVTVAPLFGPDGELAWFLGSQVDLGPADGALAQRRSGAAEKVARLPPRRLAVLRLMARGLLNKQIAWELKISDRTVKMHRALLLDDLGVRTSAEAIRIAVEAGL